MKEILLLIFAIVTIAAATLVGLVGPSLAFEELEVPSYCDPFVGTSGPDLMIGDERCNDMRGGNGGDRLEGRANEDWEYGEQGADIIEGDGGPDVLIAGCQRALCDPGLYNNLYGRAGNDRLAARNDHGTDYLNGGDGWDICTGNRYDTYVNCEVENKG